MKKRLCFIVGSLNCSGGTERVTTLIANELSKQNYKIYILSLVNGDEPFFSLNSSIESHSLYNKKISFKKNFIGILWGIRKFINEHEIDTVVSVESISCIFTIPALFGLNVKHICWEHFNFNVNLGVKLRDIGRKWAAKYCDYIVTLTKRDKELWVQGLQNIRAEIIPIPNPTSYENINHIPSLKFKTILAIGRYRYQKGYDLLMQAWSQVENKKGWRLIVVGDGEDKKKISDLVEALGIEDTVELNSATPNIEEYFKKASIYCMSSRFEGLPMVLLEAQSFGLPIVAFDCDTGPAEIIENGVSGYLIEPQNIKSFSNSISNMINLDENMYMRMSEHAKKNTDNFRSEKIINYWISII